MGLREALFVRSDNSSLTFRPCVAPPHANRIVPQRQDASLSTGMILAMGVPRQAVILAGGRGTRMLPLTRAVPKELLPVVDRPLIQRAAEEAAGAGAREIVIVASSTNLPMLRQHFTPGPAAPDAPQAERELARLVARIPVRFLLQEQALGVAHALRCARPALDGSPFLLILPDGVMLGDNVGRLLTAAAQTHGGSALAVATVKASQVDRYGIVDGDRLNDRTWRLRHIVEKPRHAKDAPTDLGVIGRYLLTAGIFDAIEAIPPGHGGELQISDALVALASTESVVAVRYDGGHIDAGQPDGLLTASVAVARLAAGSPDASPQP